MIRKSIEFFHDPEPCTIHRSAVTHRLYVEFLDFLNSEANKNPISLRWQELPDPWHEAFDWPVASRSAFLRCE